MPLIKTLASPDFLASSSLSPLYHRYQLLSSNFISLVASISASFPDLQKMKFFAAFVVASIIASVAHGQDLQACTDASTAVTDCGTELGQLVTVRR